MLGAVYTAKCPASTHSAWSILGATLIVLHTLLLYGACLPACLNAAEP